MKDIMLIREQIKEVIDEADEETLEMVLEVLQADDNDPLDNMTAEQEVSFLRGIKDADEGRATPQKEVMKKYSKWLIKIA